MRKDHVISQKVAVRNSKKLRELLKEKNLIVLIGTHNALQAKIAEKIGFKGICLGGYGTAAFRLGLPDIGFLGLDEQLSVTRGITSSVNIPLLVDIDTGYGNPINVMYTVKQMIKAGADGVVIEDQVWPKRCGHMEGKQVISVEEQIKKIKAAVQAREEEGDPNLVIVARTDSRAVYGLEDAIRRGNLYAEAGADVVFIEALRNLDELRKVPKSVNAPCLTHFIEGGKTPSFSVKQCEEMGYKIACWTLGPIFATAKAMMDYGKTLLRDGTAEAMRDRLMTFKEFNELLGLGYFSQLAKKFAIPEMEKH